MEADLPGLLGAVRRRRRRRQVVRAAAAAVVLGGVLAVWAFAAWQPWNTHDAPREPAARWSVVAVDPGVVARCTAPTVVREEWFVDDYELQQLLRDAERPDGLVRVRGQVLVSSDAVDPFPELAP